MDERRCGEKSGSNIRILDLFERVKSRKPGIILRITVGSFRPVGIRCQVMKESRRPLTGAKAEAGRAVLAQGRKMGSQRANPFGALFFTLDGNFEKVFVIGSDAWIAQSRLGAAEAETASFGRSNWHFVDRQVDENAKALGPCEPNPSP